MATNAVNLKGLQVRSYLAFGSAVLALGAIFFAPANW